MTGEAHVPVLLTEVLETLRPAPSLTLVDGTFGAGGYSRAFLEAGASVVAFDRDPTAARFAVALAPPERFGERFRLIAAPFSTMTAVVGEARIDGVALDLGMSSMQLDEAERGFSLMRDGPLDMRMGAAGPTAADLVNGAEPAELTRIFRLYGEERQARRVAGALVRRRAEQPFARTLDLADAVERALGGRRGAKIHPATRVFQALRIAVNDELGELELGLAAAERALKAGGRLAVVTFHSLEDRIVKAFLTARAGREAAPSRHAPPRASGPAPSFTLIHNGVRAPAPEEIAANPRARSAKLRAAIRTDSPVWRLAA
jgi:16S rRNA (cytosine1402-N4)-methyltransferase